MLNAQGIGVRRPGRWLFRNLATVLVARRSRRLSAGQLHPELM